MYDFYFRVYNKLQQDIKTPFRLEGVTRVDDTPVRKALREALANCLVNADYYGRRGVVIIKRPKEIILSNPGNMRVDQATAVSGGVSDPRNSTLLKMFNFIDIGERAGSGIPNIFRVWREEKWAPPILTENLDPDRFTLTLPMSRHKTSDAEKETDGKSRRKKTDGKKPTEKTLIQRATLIEYLTDHPYGTVSEMEALLGVKASRVKEILYGMIEEGIIESCGEDRNRTYRLKR